MFWGQRPYLVVIVIHCLPFMKRPIVSNLNARWLISKRILLATYTVKNLHPISSTYVGCHIVFIKRAKLCIKDLLNCTFGFFNTAHLCCALQAKLACTFTHFIEFESEIERERELDRERERELDRERERGS